MLRKGRGSGHQVLAFVTKKVKKSDLFKSQTISGMAGNFTWWDEDYGEPYPGLTAFHYFVKIHIWYIRKGHFSFLWVGLTVNSEQLFLLDKKDY